ncbi:MAG: alpha-L-rhamnosidase N-terminal domain-containing protein [Planctomycetia bacterium]|nr:alpha-L-rhamnosidase N-terminal domain-containing protein [Planctomycetia bacterium]
MFRRVAESRGMRALGSVLVLAVAAALQGSESPREYQAQWIWGNVQSPKPFQFVRFRKTIELASRPTSATAYITADTFYRLWIDGQLVMHGPARSSRGKATVDPVDVGRYLKQGKNTLTIEAFHGVCPFETLTQAPGVLCELEADSDGKREIVAATDATWEAAEITAWSRQSLRFSYQRGWVEQYDGREVLREQWRPAVVLGKVGTPPWRKVELRDIPLPAPLVSVPPTAVVAVQRSDGAVGKIEPVERYDLDGVSRPEWDRRSEWLRRLEGENLRDDAAAAVNPAGVTGKGAGDTLLEGDGASIAYDLGLGYVGFLGFEVTGRNGQVLEIAWNERLAGDGAVRPRAQVGNNAIRYVLREGRQSLVTFMPQFVRYFRVVQRGEGRITLHRLGLTEYRFDGQPKGDFRCSDDALNRIYGGAARTAMLCTLDAYMDCPHRERNTMYTLEAYSIEKILYPRFGDTSVSRRSILYGADSVDDPDRLGPPGLVQLAYPMHLPYYHCIIPGGPLFWVLHMGVYERCSGDTKLIGEMIPVMRANLAAFDPWRNSDGLLDMTGVPSVWLFFDYADVRVDGISLGLNAFYARTLDEAARLERLAGDAAHAEAYDKLAAGVRQALNRYCTGDTFYPDVLLRNEKKELVPSSEKSETTQYYVMWGHIPPPDRMERMWRALRDDFLPTPKQNSRPNHFEPVALKRDPPIRGLARAGLYPFLERMDVSAELGDHAALLRDIKAMFLPMVDSPPGTLWEDPVAEIALCHAIGCCVGGVLTEEVLGIRFGLPLKITPHNGGSLEWCKGFITTPQGRVEVAWNWRKDRYELQASIPKGMTADVVLPPEAKAVWQSAPAATPWQETVAIRADTVIVVEPGKLTLK